MLRPKIPTNPLPTGIVSPLVIEQRPQQIPATPPVAVPIASAPAPSRPTVQLTPGALLTVIGGGTAVVLVVGTVLVSMLLAVAVTAASVAICALVIRSLMASNNHR
ncbi:MULTISPECIES: SpdD-like protein [unclassified Streptomyces]|uniref:SpdD-like protein n=1 Tax=unclassified Streptomyces TaxID=2593676 RepID=UPI002DD95D97|nr:MULTISPECIES: SpdD-like protein [unclassified Streptomyces]WSC37537.1 SpdD-like protein [Streptomyces sp. NBC_01763]WSC55357.1 SpdD-like protein [Streptomyces sp. NBC_01761]WSF86193.1 SpdD-like protein [Streptomyces sp. NBC_01744]WSJ52752.1 SpdD-like protein [Streptomyces sp. NBC_01318]